MPETPSLDRAKSVLIGSTNVIEIEQALAVISEASADLERRPLLQDASLFQKLLELYTTTYISREPPKELLRSIGNLVSDNGTNRFTLVCNSVCIQRLQGLLEHYTPDGQPSELPDFAVKIFFNLCNESPETQQQALEHHIHEAVIDYVYKRTWSGTDADEMLLSISTGLLAGLLEQKPDTGSSERYTTEFVRNVMRLPSLDHLDTDSFLDTLSVASAYLQDEGFIRRTVQNKEVHLVWNVLGLVEDAMRRECGDGQDADDEEEKQYRQYLNVFAQSLANISSLSDFNDNYNLEDDFINGLGEMCVPSDDPKQHASLLPGCACLMLGNLAISDEVSIALASKTVAVGRVLQQLATSNESVFLNAAAGLLRHLAIPMANREQYFDNPEYLQNVAHLYTDVTLEQVQIAGLQLTRQILTAMPERTRRFISQQDNAARASLPALLTLSAQTTSTATKLEIARFITTCLRTLQAPSTTGKFDTPLKTLISTPSILSPLVFAIKQPLAAGVMQAQAEAWLALNLFVRVAGGAGVLAGEVSQDEEVLSLLRNRIKKTKDALVEVKDEAAETAEPVEDTRPDWVKEKERDNAILLVHDVLKAEDVSDDVKSILKGLLKETEFRVR